MSARTERDKRREYRRELTKAAGQDATMLLDELRDLRNIKVDLNAKLMRVMKLNFTLVVITSIAVAGCIALGVLLWM